MLAAMRPERKLGNTGRRYFFIPLADDGLDGEPFRHGRLVGGLHRPILSLSLLGRAAELVMAQ